MLLATRNDMRDLESRTRDDMCLDDAAMITNAGTSAAKAILEWSRRLPAALRRRFVVLAGGGNNGADAWVVADALAREGEEVVLADFHYKHKFSKGAQAVINPIKKGEKFQVIDMAVGFNIMELSMLLYAGTVLVDGLVGIGAKGALRQPLDIAVGLMSRPEHLVPTVALDIPSGLDADDGSGDVILRADLTLAMGFMKRGFFVGRGPEVTGEIQCVDFGCPQNRLFTCNHNARHASEYAFGIDDAAALLRPRSHLVHKNSLGRALLLCGSGQYNGAPFLAASGALRVGCGLVKLVIPAAARKRPGDAALIVRELPECTYFEARHVEELAQELPWADAILLGPGISLDAAPEVLQALLNQPKPLVLDADGLRILAAHPEFLKNDSSERQMVLTPHPGEMAALLTAFAPEAANASRQEQAMALARATGAVVLLKGPRTIVATAGDHEQCSYNVSGNCALATAGSGDVLSGIIVALAAQMPLAEAARLGAFIHGLAADIYVRSASPRGLIADDLTALIPLALRECGLW